MTRRTNPTSHTGMMFAGYSRRLARFTKKYLLITVSVIVPRLLRIREI
jgi:hypothetical protein